MNKYLLKRTDLNIKGPFIMFIFSFCCEAKRENEPKEKNTLITAMLRIA